MTKPKFSPAVWEVSWNTFGEGSNHGIYARGEMDLKGFQIAIVNGYPTMSNDADEKTGEANAMLIAAAPDLYNAAALLRSVMEMYKQEDGTYLLPQDAATIVLKQVDNALEKAGSYDGYKKQLF